MDSNPARFSSLTSPDGAHLLGSRCNTCGETSFPVAQSCQKCGDEASSVVGLAPTGTVWTFTVQRFRPKSPFVGPVKFEPFAVGYVDLGDVKVEARLAGKSVDEWRIGDEVRLACGDIQTDKEPYETFWFEPIQ